MTSENATEIWLTTAQVSNLLGITPAAVRAAARDGRLQVAGMASNIRLFRREDVEQFAQHRARNSRN